VSTSSSGPRSDVSRRTLFKGTAAALGLAATPSLIAACSSASSSPSGATGPSAVASGTTLTFGSNYSDPATKAAFAGLAAAAVAASSVAITVNTVDHNTFQNNISAYLQGTPDALCTWFAGYRMQYFATQGLLEPIDDVWAKIGTNFNSASQSLSKGPDGKYYFVPIYNYPWVVFYNKSTFARNNYAVPTTWDEFIALCRQMKRDGLIPMAFADKDLWPALGTFDILNLRINGFDYHMKLMQNRASYSDPQVTAVFKQWAELLPYCQSGANGRLWQDAAKTLESKKAGMMFQGTNQVGANYSAKNRPDLDFFPFPVINTDYGQDYMDAPADGFMVPKRGQNLAGAKAVLEYIGSGPAEAAFLKTDKWDVGLATTINTSQYNAIQLKSAKAIAACKNVAQFGDRDTDPVMAAALESLIQKFIDRPNASTIASIQASAAKQAQTIFG
jgi:multiple sugar transport system substrate-binding protein